MISSMTGYGKAVASFANKTISVEIKSVNSKVLDMYIRWSGVYKELEQDLRSLLATRLKRGKIDVCVSVREDLEGDGAVLNLDKFSLDLKSIGLVLNEIRRSFPKPLVGEQNILAALLQKEEFWSEKIHEVSQEELDANRTFFLELANKAIDNIIEFRLNEGKSLQNDLIEHLGLITEALSKVAQFEENRIIKIRERLEKSFGSLFTQSLSENSELHRRFEEEMIYYIERLDINEEKVRLAEHCRFFEKTMKEEDCGKKLAFIAQEMGREINTLGSKANEENIQKIVVVMKDELEKIKEQLFNIM